MKEKEASYRLNKQHAREGNMTSGGIQTHATLHSRQSALPAELPRQLSWLDPNLTSHSTPDEQADYQLSMKEKAMVHVQLGGLQTETLYM